ncbi:hypothetical protein CUJ84_pRLN2000137 (plasmid) [Rhizobium leguminosarum]|uniref:Uncharacterized protein n=1 Tax=Rhizobium leguminosarum TaxID=384 RepID=A0A2K9ZEL0_RHILE|nr:hypothetical protein CUJ84_pRLN2000137 [Rhizobium leguminosarum]
MTKLVQNRSLVGLATRSISLDSRFVQFRSVAILVRLAIRPPNQDDNNGFIPSGRDPNGNNQRLTAASDR